MSDDTSETTATPALIGRQPVLGREQQLLAYALYFRDGVIATADRVALLDPSAQQAIGPYRCYLDVDHNLLFSELIEALPASLVVLEILANVEPTLEVIARCAQLRGRGFTLAVADAGLAGEGAVGSLHPLLELADIIKVDVTRFSADALRQRVAQLKPLGRQLLAENLQSAEQMALCQSLGFDLFQGYSFAQPALVAGKKLNPSQLALMRLLALVMADAETAEIENAFKLEPGLTVNLLRLTNSVGSGLTTRITSLRHAIAIIGRRQLQRWLQLLVYTTPAPGAGDQGGAVSPLLMLAATRGRLMELLADRVLARNREFADQAFMVGILSLMPALLGIAMPEILDQLPAAPRVRLALTDFGGQHGQLLQLVIATEQIDPELLEEARARLPSLSPAFIEQSLAAALSWANHLGAERGDRVD